VGSLRVAHPARTPAAQAGVPAPDGSRARGARERAQAGLRRLSAASVGARTGGKMMEESQRWRAGGGGRCPAGTAQTAQLIFKDLQGSVKLLISTIFCAVCTL